MPEEVTAGEQAPDAEQAAGERPAAEPTVPTMPATVSLDTPSAPATTDPVSVWPFFAYVAAWSVFALLTVWKLLEVPRGQAVFESTIYPLSVFGGLALATLGPFVIIAAWLGAPCPVGVKRTTLFPSALTKGSIAMLVGVSLWWAALIVVDGLRLGRIL